MLCYYCSNVAKYLQIINDFGAEGHIDYDYPVCEDHKEVEHHSPEGFALWKKNILRRIREEDKELLFRLGSDYDSDGMAYWEKWKDK